MKVNTAYTRAQECLFIVGNLNILQSPGIGRDGPVEFVFESLNLLEGRKAFKNFTSLAPTETVDGVVLEKSELAKNEGMLAKGSGRKDKPRIDHELASGLTRMVIDAEAGFGRDMRRQSGILALL